MRGYYGRKGDFILKLAMIISASRGDSMLITSDEIEIAVEVLGKNESFMEKALGQLSQTETGKISNKVLAMIVRMGTVDHSTLMRMCRHMLSKDELWMVLNTLDLSGEIVTKRTPTGGLLYSLPPPTVKPLPKLSPI